MKKKLFNKILSAEFSAADNGQALAENENRNWEKKSKTRDREREREGRKGLKARLDKQRKKYIRW